MDDSDRPRLFPLGGGDHYMAEPAPAPTASSVPAPQPPEAALQQAVSAGVQSLAKQWTSGATSDTSATAIGAVVGIVLQSLVDIGWDRTAEVLTQLAVERGPTLLAPIVSMAIYAWARRDR